LDNFIKIPILRSYPHSNSGHTSGLPWKIICCWYKLQQTVQYYSRCTRNNGCRLCQNSFGKIRISEQNAPLIPLLCECSYTSWWHLLSL